jgi:CIC family chloride channel protein
MGDFPGVGFLGRINVGRAIAARRRKAAAAARRPSAVARHRRDLGAWVLHAPQTLRALVRGSEIWLVVLAAVVGLIAGLCVTVMMVSTQEAHRLFFGLGAGQHLSSQVSVNPFSALIVPVLGGLVMGALGLLAARWGLRQAADPIEANALFGGRMGMNGSLLVVAQTMISNGAGASVGLEAGYAQIGSALASKLGQAFRLRRNDLRVLLGCGAAGAIAAAFNAPFTGAFYAFELVIGTYTLVTLAPVVVSAIVGVSVVRWLIPNAYVFDVRVPTEIAVSSYLPILAIGIICALGGIALMRAVTLSEQAFRATKLPAWARPALGGLLLGCLALISPKVLSSGHAALHVTFDAPYGLPEILLLILLKTMGSAISLGAGFRGGLFFASLFVGSLVGKAFAAALALMTTAPLIPPVVCALVGMSALAVAVVGGPLTMAFLALETTGSLPMTVAVLGAAVVSALTVRRTFGYSFATWRFHLRGEAIRSAVDIGWMRNLTVGRMMRREVRTVRADTSLAAFRRDFPLGASSRVVVIDEANRYLGIVMVAEAHADEDGAGKVTEMLHYQDEMLLPQMTIKAAVGVFEQAEADALVVVDGTESRRVIGILTEQYALRRYTEELDRRRRELAGE